MTESGHLMVGPDGGQLLGFLCGLGLLDAAARALEGRQVRMAFRWHAVGWRPLLRVEPPVDREALVEALHGWIGRQAEAPELTELGDDLPCPAPAFARLAGGVAFDTDRAVADRVAALGFARPESVRFEDTAFRTMSGAGHQHFLAFARQIARLTSRAQIEAALFAPWKYEDERPSMRFDPADDRRYALRADDPARGAPIRTVRAANALAVEGLRFLPVVPADRGARTTLVDLDVRPPGVRWGIWERPVDRDQVASLLCHPDLVHAPGVVAVFECHRIQVDRYRAFTPARRIG